MVLTEKNKQKMSLSKVIFRQFQGLLFFLIHGKSSDVNPMHFPNFLNPTLKNHSKDIQKLLMSSQQMTVINIEIFSKLAYHTTYLTSSTRIDLSGA